MHPAVTPTRKTQAAHYQQQVPSRQKSSEKQSVKTMESLTAITSMLESLN